METSTVRNQLFRALADPSRRALFERLCQGGAQSVGALTAPMGISQPAVSKHLRVLREAGLVSDRHEGRMVHYSPRPEALDQLDDWTREMRSFWHKRFDNIEDVLNKMDQ